METLSVSSSSFHFTLDLWLHGYVLFSHILLCCLSTVWKYNAENDSVMQVSQKDYERCDRSEPIRGYKDGHTKIELKRSGPFYFISGEEGYCQRGEKLLVVVLSPNHNRSYAADAPLTAPVTKNKGSDHVLINQAQRSIATVCFLVLPLVLLV